MRIALSDAMQDTSDSSVQMAAIKVGASALIAAGVSLLIWQWVFELPAVLDRAFWNRVSAIATVAIVIHAVEGLIAAVLTLKLTTSAGTASARVKATVQAGLYVFFVGTVGLWEIIKADKEKNDTTS